jgi:hypothetical protein
MQKARRYARASKQYNNTKLNAELSKKIAIQEQIPETQFYLKSGPDV